MDISIFSNLPDEIIKYILSFYPILKKRRGKWIKQIAPERREVLYSIPPFFSFDYPTFHEEQRFQHGYPFSIYSVLSLNHVYRITISKTTFGSWEHIEYIYCKRLETQFEEQSCIISPEYIFFGHNPRIIPRNIQ